MLPRPTTLWTTTARRAGPPLQEEPTTTTPNHPASDRKRAIQTSRRELFTSESNKKSKSFAIDGLASRLEKRAWLRVSGRVKEKEGGQTREDFAENRWVGK
ncbi:hypothetical protein ABKV19_025074 [Rosa sericea]